jgi:hypothetical protein
LNRYLDLTDGDDGLSAMSLFSSLRAAIRAPTAMDRAVHAERKPEMAAEARRYLDLAVRLLRPREAISEIARLRRSLPEPGPENRAAISIRSARPPIIAVIGASPCRRRIKMSPLCQLKMTLPGVI